MSISAFAQQVQRAFSPYEAPDDDMAAAIAENLQACGYGATAFARAVQAGSVPPTKPMQVRAAVRSVPDESWDDGITNPMIQRSATRVPRVKPPCSEQQWV